MELFHRPIPDLPGVPHALTEVLRYGMANDPRARPTATQLHDLLNGLQLTPPASTYVPPPRLTGGDDTPTVHTASPAKPPQRRKRFFGLLGIQDS